MKPTFLPLILLLTLLTTNAVALVRYVNVNSASPAPPFTSWATAATNIQNAVDVAVPGDEVLVTNGIYDTGGGTLYGTNRVAVDGKKITIQSVNGPAVTIIEGYQLPNITNGVGAVRCVSLQDGSVLSGFIITDGATETSVTPDGGGVYCDSTLDVVSNCIITGNSAYSGGGGVYSGTLENCIISGNSAYSTGGGVMNSLLSACVISNNYAGSGGGLYLAADTEMATNCLIVSNTAAVDGGGSFQGTFINCTITGNVSDGSGGGVYGGAGAWLYNSIIYFNFSSNAPGFNTYDSKCDNCCTTPAVVGDANITNDPAFVNVSVGNFHLSATSPCINAGNNSYITNATDLDGNPRIFAGIVDIGAYEYQGYLQGAHLVSLASTNPVAPYLSWVTAATNIQDAINAASPGDFIVVSNGVYQSGGQTAAGDTASNRVVINQAVTVQSLNGPAATIIAGLPGDGGFSSSSTSCRCVYLTNGAVLSGFTLTNGAAINGGAVWCASTSAIISNCVLVHNYAGDYGGGAYQGTLNNCLVSNCTAFLDGGGTYQANLNNCVVSSNRLVQGFGGGGSEYGILNNCLITGNSGSIGGGASSNILNNCILQYNKAGNGAAAYGSTLINCTVVSNIVNQPGNGATIVNCNATNCIVYDNNSHNGTNWNNSSLGCCDTTPQAPGFDNITNDPAFVNVAGGNYHLLSSSPCINSGNNAVVATATDFDGNPRIVGGTIDMGAYEFQGIHLVALNGTNPVAPYLTWQTAATNIQDAINAANSGDFVLVSNGIYQITINTTNAISVQSVNGPGVTWINGNQAGSCATLADGSALTGFTLTNGYGFNGGGANCATANVFINNCLMVSNTAWANFGGAVFNGTLSNCMLLDNNGNNGGGAAYATLDNCTLGGNVSGIDGGGAYDCTLNNCILFNNQAETGGGAYASTLNDCVVSNNTAMLTSFSEGGTQIMGGGMWAGSANNCIISYNHVVNQYGDTRVVYGGGAYGSRLTNCLLFMNTANQYFGGGGGAYGGTLNNCTIVANSTYATAGGTYNSTVNNSIIRYNGSDYSGGALNYCVTIPLAPGIGNITNDPVFVNQNAPYDFHLQSTSPCINSGNNAYVAGTTDLDGNPRIQGGTVDVGAYEYQTPKSVISYAWLQQYGLPTDGSVDFQDLDGTGFEVYQDWVAGLNPTNSASVLVMMPPAPTNNASGITVTWQSVSGINYNLQRADQSLQSPFVTIQGNITGQAGTTSYTDTTATNPIPYFYRVGVQ